MSLKFSSPSSLKTGCAWLLAAALIAPACGSFGGMPAEDDVGERQDPIINGTVVSAEGSGEISLSVGCSGTLLTNSWILSARHCFSDANQANPGGVTATMGSQSRSGAQIVRHASLDVALMRVSSPFTMNGSTSFYTRSLYGGSISSLDGKTLTCHGYGRSTYTGGSGTLRRAYLQVTSTSSTSYTVSRNSSGQIQWKGDSGGTCVETTSNSVPVISGVQSTCSHNAEQEEVYTCNQVAAPAFSQWAFNTMYGVCPADFHGLPASHFQACFDAQVAVGRWPVTLSAYDVGGTLYMAGSFQPGTSRPVRHLMTAASYQQNFSTFAAQGFRPAHISVVGTSSGPRFTVIWRQAEGPFVAHHGITQDVFTQKFNEYHAQGYILSEVIGYPDGGLRYAAVWVKRAYQSYYAWVNMTSAFYNQKFSELTPQGYRVVRFNAQVSGGETRYSAIFEKLPPAGWYHWYGLTAADYQQKYDTHSAQGMRLSHISALGSRFSAIFVSP